MNGVRERILAVDAEIATAMDRTMETIKFVSKHSTTSSMKVALLNSIVVTIVSIVEEGIRSIFVEYLSICEENVNPYSKLRTDLCRSNLESASFLLKRAGDKGSNTDPLVIANALLGCLKDDSSYKLFKEELVYNKGNMRTAEITGIAKRIGIRNLWALLSARQEILNAYPDFTDQQIQTKIIEQWNSIFDERDIIVHRISQASGWGDTTIIQHIDFLKLSIRNLSECIIDDLSDYFTQRGAGIPAPIVETDRAHDK